MNTPTRGVTTVAGRFDIPKRLLRAALPRSFRISIARGLSKRSWAVARRWWAQEMLRDLADADPNTYHRFLWGHHLAYAETYEVALRFGADRIHATRRMLFDDLLHCLGSIGVETATIRSVFEIGCSLGYNLHFLEQQIFRDATVLEGCDIDAYAIEQGRQYLRSIGSRVNVFTADMAELNDRLGDHRYDVSVCAGVLMYLERNDAQRVVADILRHTTTIAAFAGLADPDRDNSTLADSGVRAHDGTFVHDLDGMVARAGGRVLQRRWEGSRTVNGNTIYFVFAEPATA